MWPNSISMTWSLLGQLALNQFQLVSLSYPILVGEENKPLFIRVWKLSPNKRVLKP